MVRYRVEWVAMTDVDFEPFEEYRERRAPIYLLGLAALAVAASFALLAFTSLTTHIVGYVLGSFVCVVLVALFIKVDHGRRTAADVVYLELRSARYAWSFVLASGVAGCVVHAWYLATELAARP